MKECSTDGALRKQFKLKLPSNIPKNSTKCLHAESQDHIYHPKIMSKKSTHSKLSINERLERI